MRCATLQIMPSCRIEDEMKIAVSAQEQELRVHLTAAILSDLSSSSTSSVSMT